MQEKEKGTEPSVLKEKESVISVAWIVTAILAVIIIVVGVLLATKGSFSLGGYTLVLSKGNYKILSVQEASDKVTKYINEDLLQSKMEAKVSDFKDEKGIYKFSVALNGQNIESYMSKDGSLFFPEAYQTSGETTDANANTNSAAAKEVPKTDKPTVQLFTMSYCPYGNEAEDAMKPVVDLLKEKVAIEPHYVIYSDYAKNSSADWKDYCTSEDEKYCSMHGIQEVNEDVRELCIYKNEADKFWPFIEKVNTACTSKNVDSCWEQVAKDAGIDTVAVKKCQTDEADALLAKEVELNSKYGISGSPALVINDTQSSATRTADGYKTGICSAFNAAPTECDQKLESAGTATNTNASCAN